MATLASRIITMLPSTPQVEAVYLDPTHGILAGLQDLPQILPSSSLASSSPVVQNLESVSSSTTSPFAPTSTSGEVVPTPHTILIDQTTLDPTTAIRVATTVESSTNGRALMLDAPVSGGISICFLSKYHAKISLSGIVAAAAGLLTIMCGSPSPVATSLALPLLRRMARDGGVVECGGNGTGVGVKVCNKLACPLLRLPPIDLTDEKR